MRLDAEVFSDRANQVITLGELKPSKMMFCSASCPIIRQRYRHQKWLVHRCRYTFTYTNIHRNTSIMCSAKCTKTTLIASNSMMSNQCCADRHLRIPDEARWMGSPTSCRSCRSAPVRIPMVAPEAPVPRGMVRAQVAGRGAYY